MCINVGNDRATIKNNFPRENAIQRVLRNTRVFAFGPTNTRERKNASAQRLAAGRM